MPTFTLTPNLRVLNRYLTTTTDEEFDSLYPDYAPEQITNTVEWKLFDDIPTFECDYKVILKKYGIEKHYDNLLYLTLYVFDQVWNNIQLAYDDYDSKKRARELAQLLLMLKYTKQGKLSGISFKSFTGTAKLTDLIVNDWISQTLIKALEAKEFLIGEFGNSVLNMLAGTGSPIDNEPINIEKLKKYANMRLVHPRTLIKKGTATISLSVYSYLQQETNLKSADGSIFSDAQLNFLFELLQLLKQVDALEIDSEPKDYMRTLLVNNISANS